MPLIQWSLKLSVGIQEIDHQHMKLILMINQLYDAMKAGEANLILSNLLHELTKYTVYHFTYEERLFAEYGFPDAKNHIMAHTLLASQVKTLQEELAAGKPALTVEVMQLLKDWLNNHILGEDKGYELFFKSKGLR